MHYQTCSTISVELNLIDKPRLQVAQITRWSIECLPYLPDARQVFDSGE
jgi:hypothetical protein